MTDCLLILLNFVKINILLLNRLQTISPSHLSQTRSNTPRTENERERERELELENFNTPVRPI